MNEQQILRISNESLNLKTKFTCLKEKVPHSLTNKQQFIMIFDIVKTYILRL